MQNILPFLHNQTLLQALVEKTGLYFCVAHRRKVNVPRTRMMMVS
jgi:hypothetical protein